jgi:hypothetical protein
VPEEIARAPEAVAEEAILPIELLADEEVLPAEVGICTTCHSEFEHARRRGRKCTLCPGCRKKPRAKAIKMCDTQPGNAVRRCAKCGDPYEQPLQTKGRPTTHCPAHRKASRLKAAA